MLLIDLHEVTLPHSNLLAQAIMEAVKSEKMPAGWKEFSRHLTEEERGKERAFMAKRMLDIFRTLPSDKEFEAAAHAGQAKKGWYAASAKALMDVFGPDTPRFAALLASFSPQISVAENLRLAVRFWEKWIDSGRPQNQKEIDAIGVDTCGPDRWHGVQRPDGTFKAGMPWRGNVAKSITHEHPEKIVLSSGGEIGKVDNFRGNLLGDLSRVTNDAWMAHFAGIEQSVFSKKNGYSAMIAKVRRVAKKMGWEPAEVQETIWSFFKALHESQNQKSKGKKALEKLTHDQVSQSEDFADLMVNDKEVNDALQRLRDRGLVGTPSPRLRDGGQDPTGSPQSAATQRGLAGSLTRIADRAEKLKNSQDYQSFATEGYHFPNATDIKWDRKRITFTLTDPREIAEWKEKPRKPEDSYRMVVGMKGKRWNTVSGVVHGVPTVHDDGKAVTISLPFKERGSMESVKVNPEKWRKVEADKQAKAAKILKTA